MTRRPPADRLAEAAAVPTWGELRLSPAELTELRTTDLAGLITANEAAAQSAREIRDQLEQLAVAAPARVRRVRSCTSGRRRRGTLALLKAHRKTRAALAFTLGRYFREAVGRCIRAQVADAASAGLGQVDTVPPIHLHSLRHTAATLMLGAGVHPKIVQERLGHQTISITLDTYSHALPTLQRDAADVLGA